MKPKKKNLVLCPDCGRRKIFFETEAKANNFIKYNGEDIDTHGGELRPYYCPACCGYHISSKPHKWNYDSQTDRLIEAYKKDLELAKEMSYKSADKDTVEKTDNDETNYHIDEITKILPADLKTKTDVKNFLTAYFEEHGIKKQVKQDPIRHYFNELIKHGQLNVDEEPRKEKPKELTDEELFESIPAEEKDTYDKFMKALRLSETVINEDRRDALEKMWYEYNYNLHNK